jgi:excisionase family DNA binding protein
MKQTEVEGKETKRNEEYLTITQTAKRLNLHENTIHKMIKDKKLNAKIFGERAYRISVKEVEKYIEEADNG